MRSRILRHRSGHSAIQQPRYSGRKHYCSNRRNAKIPRCRRRMSSWRRCTSCPETPHPAATRWKRRPGDSRRSGSISHPRRTGHSARPLYRGRVTVRQGDCRLIEKFSENPKRKRNFQIARGPAAPAVYERRKDWAAAAADLAELLKVDPENAAAHYRLGLALFMQKKFREGFDEFKRREQDQDKNLPRPDVSAALITISSAAGRPENAGTGSAVFRSRDGGEQDRRQHAHRLRPMADQERRSSKRPSKYWPRPEKPILTCSTC